MSFASLQMPIRGSGSITGCPDIRDAELSLKRRKSSFTEPPLKPHANELPGNDVLLDPLIIGQSLHVSNYVDSPIDNVRRILSDDNHQLIDNQILTEMLHLTGRKDGNLYWEQTARWIKYEQVVEGDMTRFSKPHITLLTIQGLLQVRNCLKRGIVLLDVEQEGFNNIIDVIVDAMADKHRLNEKNKIRLRHVLLAKKYHLGGIPTIDVYDKSYSNRKLVDDNGSKDEEGIDLSSIESDSDSEEEPPTINVGLSEEKREAKRYNKIKKVINANKHLLERFTESTVSASILVGEAPFLTRPVTAFVRLKQAQNLHPNLPDIPIPTKFIFVVLSPTQNYDDECKNIGRTMGAIFADEIWRQVAFNTKEPFTLADAVEEFVSQMIVIPPGKCDVSTRWEPRPVETKRTVGMICGVMNYHIDDDDDVFEKELDEEMGKFNDNSKSGSSHEQAIVRSGRMFGGLNEDIRRKLPVVCSDFVDFFRGRLSQSLAATVFMFFANITSIITFGAVMERTLHHQMAAIEAILCGGISGVIFALFSGQPLIILSATGPTLVFEKILFDFCVGNGWEFLPFRLWVGVWIAIYLIIFVATDMSALVGLISRFTEEAFATLISVVFIIQAFQKLIQISHDAPLFPDPREVFHSPCYCYLSETMQGTNDTIMTKYGNYSGEKCEELGGEAVGLQCFFKPDVYMLSVLLTFGTFLLAYLLSKFRKTKFFTSSFRNSISDFAVLLSIICMTLFSHFIGLDVPVLHMPESFRPSLHRDWFISPSSTPIIVALIASLPAAFYTILIVMDQQITAVIVNRKDNKLRKGGGYHLDLLIIAVLVLICSFLGLPYFVAATVQSVMHVDSLRVYSESIAPGEVPTFLGVNEQRLSGILSHLLIGLSVFLTPIIKMVPLPVLIGIFLYMGVVSLLGQQFVQRITLLFMPDKHQPDYIWLRMVRMYRVHYFTFFQIAAIGALFAVKYTTSISMMFPLMLVFMVLIRMFVLEKIFTRSELVSLDDLVPSFSQIMKPKEKKLIIEDEHLMEDVDEKKKKNHLM